MPTILFTFQLWEWHLYTRQNVLRSSGTISQAIRHYRNTFITTFLRRSSTLIPPLLQSFDLIADFALIHGYPYIFLLPSSPPASSSQSCINSPLAGLSTISYVHRKDGGSSHGRRVSVSWIQKDNASHVCYGESRAICPEESDQFATCTRR